MTVTGTHTSMLGSGSHIKLSIHVTVTGSVGKYPSLHNRITVAPGPTIPLETSMVIVLGILVEDIQLNMLCNYNTLYAYVDAKKNKTSNF